MCASHRAASDAWCEQGLQVRAGGRYETELVSAGWGTPVRGRDGVDEVLVMRARLLATMLALIAMNSAHAADNTAATLIYFDAVSNQTLDPQEPQNNSSFAQGPLMAIYNFLVYLNEAGDPKPGLASSWQYSTDLTEITLKLRQDVKFHDGTAFNATAVARNFERTTALGTRAGFASSETMSQIASVDLQADDTVRLKLKQPNGQMPYLLGSQAGMMISPAVLTEGAFGASLKPVGTGPFKVRSFNSNVRTVMDRHDGYWGGTAGRPAAIDHHFVPDGRARLNAVRSGQANLALIDPRLISEAKGAGYAVQINEKNSTWDIYLNVKRETIGKLSCVRHLCTPSIAAPLPMLSAMVPANRRFSCLPAPRRLTSQNWKTGIRSIRRRRASCSRRLATRKV